jgi:GGDEF domain-containing protein
VGDVVIQLGVDYLREHLIQREGDLIGRDGGDESVLVYPLYESSVKLPHEEKQTSTEQAQSRTPEQAIEDLLLQQLSGANYTEYVKTRLKEEVEKRKKEGKDPLNLSDEDIAEIAVSFRYGTAVSIPDDTAISLIARADEAMQEKQKLEQPEDQR